MTRAEREGHRRGGERGRSEEKAQEKKKQRGGLTRSNIISRRKEAGGRNDGRNQRGKKENRDHRKVYKHTCALTWWAFRPQKQIFSPPPPSPTDIPQEPFPLPHLLLGTPPPPSLPLLFIKNRPPRPFAWTPPPSPLPRNRKNKKYLKRPPSLCIFQESTCITNKSTMKLKHKHTYMLTLTQLNNVANHGVSAS